jgi:hypothetical protein
MIQSVARQQDNTGIRGRAAEPEVSPASAGGLR